MKYFIQKALTDWAYKVNDGCPDPQNRTHIQVLEAVLRQHGCSEEFISEYLPRVQKLHELDFKDKAAFNAYSAKHNIKPDTKVTIGGVETTAGEAEAEEDGTLSKEEAEGVSNYMDGKYGVDVQIAKTLEKGIIGEGDKEHLKNLQNDVNTFLKNPTQENAKKLVEKYDLATNASGEKLYIQSIPGNGKYAFGNPSGLTKKISAAIAKANPEFLKSGDEAKKIKNMVTAASKPDISGAPADDETITYIDSKGNEKTTTAKSAKKAKRGHPAREAWLKKTSIATADNDETVKTIFNREPFNYLSSSMHEVFGPKGEDGMLLDNKGGKNARTYLKQSLNNNTALKNTIGVLKELESQGKADPRVSKALEDHQATMNDIAENYDIPSPEAEKAVLDSYANMAIKMHEADSKMTDAIMKNVAEMGLYDSELAAGVEAYLPSAGTFPSGDKIRIDRDGNGVVEKVAAVSCKYGKASNGTYGFPGETQQYIKFHPDKSKRDLLNNRIGAPGYSLGCKDSVIDDKEQYDQLMEESGLGTAFKEGGAEKVRQKMKEVKDKIAKLIGPPPVKKDQLLAKADELKALNKEVAATLKENIDLEQLTEIVGRQNVKTFMKGGAQAIGIITFGASIATSNGLDTIEHHHQVIDKDGYHQETEKASPKLKHWNLTDRMTDGRGGGIIAGSLGSGEEE